MARKPGIKGKLLDVWVPEWEPLLDLAPAHVADFMWMGTVELRDQTRLQLYKHYWTRRYLHLDGDGRAFGYVEPDRYVECPAGWLLVRVLDEHTADQDWLDVVHPPRRDPDDIRLAWKESATKNGISRQRSEYVIKHCGLRYKHQAAHGAPRWREARTLFLGEDAEGVEIEVAAVGDDVNGDGFVVFHAAELRDGYRGLLARGKRWRQ